MALQKAKLASIQYVGSSAGSIYSNPASTKSLVRGFVLHNTNTTTEVVSLHYIDNNAGAVGTASAANRIYMVTVQPDETIMIEIPFALVLVATNDAIVASTTTASKVTVVVTGDQDL